MENEPSLVYLKARDIFGNSIEIDPKYEKVYHNGIEIDSHTDLYRAGNLPIKDPRSANEIMYVKSDDFYLWIQAFNFSINGIKSHIHENLLSTLDTRNSSLRNNLVGYVSPDKKFFYIRINKNASTKLVNFFTKNNWSLVDIHGSETNFYYERSKLFCVLREPYERYLTGLTQFLTSPDPDNQIWQFLVNVINKESKFEVLKMLFDNFDTFDFDFHTKLQSSTIGNQDYSKINFFYLDDSLVSNLTTFFKNNNCDLIIDNTKVNYRSTTNSIYASVKMFFEDKNNLQYKISLLQYLKPDYILINSVKFFEE